MRKKKYGLNLFCTFIITIFFYYLIIFFILQIIFGFKFFYAIK